MITTLRSTENRTEPPTVMPALAGLNLDTSEKYRPSDDTQ
jgi:hypothetical protein